jgi:hypothetical protein
MDFWGKVGKMLNPRKQVAALVDSVMTRIGEKYRVKIHVDATIEIVDVKPDETVTLPGDDSG